jgi:hypothetical protein
MIFVYRLFCTLSALSCPINISFHSYMLLFTSVYIANTFVIIYFQQNATENYQFCIPIQTILQRLVYPMLHHMQFSQGHLPIVLQY